MDAYAEFFLAVVNGKERHSLQFRREEFRREYGLFFPANTANTIEGQRWGYSDARQFWTAPSKTIPVEQPDSEYGLHVVILRHKLRVIWAIADSGDIVWAEKKCKSLYAEVHRYLRLGAQDRPFESWRIALETACQVHLLKIVKNLKICENPSCRREPYFIRHGRAKYCCIPCSVMAKELRQRERDMLRPPKQYKRTTKARKKMAVKKQEFWDKKRGRI
jgi:hypothetical protein